MTHNESCSPPARPSNTTALPDDVEAAINTYGRRISDPRWAALGSEIAHVVRLVRPRTGSEARLLMGLTWRITQHGLDNRHCSSPREAFTVRTVESFLMAQRSAHTRSTYRAPLMRLHAAVNGLPEPRRRPQRSARAERPVTTAEAQWLNRIMQAEPLMTIMRDGLTPIVLETVGRRLTRRDIAAFREVLRG